MSTITLDIATILQDNGFGTIDTDIFTSKDMPPKPDVMTLLTLVPSGKTPFPGVGIPLEYGGVQIIVREAKGDAQLCESRMVSIKNFLKSIANYLVNSIEIVNIMQEPGASEIGIDPTMRPLYTANFVALKDFS